MAFVNRLQKTLGTTLRKRLAPILPVLFGALIVALVTVATLQFTGVIGSVPSISVPLLGWTITPRLTAFLLAGVVSLVIGLCYLSYRRYREPIYEYWGQYSTWAQALIIGCVCGLVVALGLGIGALFGRVHPASVVLGFLVAWPTSAGLLLLIDHRSDGADSSFSSVKIGYVHTRGLESRTLSIILGLLVAVAGGLGIWYVGARYFDGISLAVTALGTLVLWLGITVIVYNKYDATTTERTDISIVAVSTPESRPTRELTIKNESAASVDLSESRLRDTEFELYRLGVTVTLRPGAVCTFEIPESFTLEPNDDSVELPLGYSLKRGGETPTLFTKTGEIYSLQWSESATERPKTVDSSTTVPDDEDVPADRTDASGGADAESSLQPSGPNPATQD